MMNDADALDHYLSGLREKGELDSEGVFTVAGLRAVGQLAHFLLAEDSDWILKIVQSACRGKAAELRINQTRKSTQISYQLPYSLELSQFEKCLISSIGKSSAAGVYELACALRAVGLGQRRDWAMELKTAKETTLISCTEGSICADRRESSGSEGTSIVMGVSYPVGEAGKLGGIVRFGEAIQKEHMALLLKARACPIPLFLDGQRIDDLSEPGLTTALETKSFLAINTPKSEAPEISIPQAIASAESYKLEDRFGGQAPFLLSKAPASGLSSSLQRWHFNYRKGTEEIRPKSSSILHPLEAPSRVYLVRDGVIVGKQNIGLRHSISCDIFLSADNHRSDLSGLQVHVSESEVHNSKREIRSALPFLRGLFQELAKHRVGPSRNQLYLYGGLGALGMLFPPLSLKAVAGTVTTLMLARSAQQHKRLVQLCLVSLDDFISRIDIPET